MGTNTDITTGKKFDWSVTADGHGTNAFIDIIRKTDFSELMVKSDPITHIIEHFRSLDGTYLQKNNKSSGSTIIIVKIFDDLIEGAIIGDSKCTVFIDDKQVFTSTPHNIKNPLEIQRLSSRTNIVTNYNGSPIVKIIGDNTAILVPSIYTTFENKKTLGLTQALGHDCITEFAPEKFSIPYNKEQHLRFVAASDGFWDMFLEENTTGSILSEINILKDKLDIMKMNAPQLVQKVFRRWTQDWNIYNEQNPQLNSKCSFPKNGYDDICVFVWDNKIGRAHV